MTTDWLCWHTGGRQVLRGLLSLTRRALPLEVVLLVPLELSNGGVALPTVGRDKWTPAGVSDLVLREVGAFCEKLLLH